MSSDAALILCRFLTDGAAILLWGTSAYLCTLVPAGLARQLDRRLRLPQVIAIVITIAMTAGLLPLRAATIGNGWHDAIDRHTIEAVLFHTNIGSAWIAQVLAVLLLLGSNLKSVRWRQSAVAISTACLLIVQPFTGHAAMNDGGRGIAHKINDCVHLLSGGAWLGSLVVVLMLLRMLASDDNGTDARMALMRFSIAGHVAVALVIMTGIANMLLIIGGPPFDWSFPYQALLFAKILLVGGMAVLAIANRYVFVPQLSTSHDIATKRLITATIAEVVLGIAIVGLVAWFGTLEPN